MNAILDVILLTSLVAHVILISYLLFARRPTRYPPGGLLLPVLFSLIALLIHVLPADALPVEWARDNSGFLSALVLAAMLVSYGRYAIRDMLGHQHRLWLILGVLWLLAMIVSAFAVDSVAVGREDWLLTLLIAPDVPGLVTFMGLGLVAGGLVAVAFYAFYRAVLPEAANRALFWVLNSAALALGVLLFISGTPVLRLIGSLMIAGVLVSATYAHVAYRVFDIRGGIITALRTAVFVVLATVVIFTALLVAGSLRAETTQDPLLTWLVLAVLAAIAFALVRRLALLVAGLFFQMPVNPTRAAREYSQQVSKATDLDDLIALATTTLNRVMSVRRSGIILVNDTSHEGIEVVVMRESGDEDSLKGTITNDGPIYAQLAARKLPLSQFDLDFDPHYRALGGQERQFFHDLQMSAYAPIVIENALVGILLCGPKLNDAPFYSRDLELLATMADQTGVALRNSRSLADLTHLNRAVMGLNADLEEANLQYEKLDSVKTDFITIASHELRTPLAQVRGYTDIIDALNEQGMLDQEQISGMVANLRKAVERTEELLSAMLDMSQLDVNAMDLRFAQASPESIVRMAIEPLTEHIKQRKLTLSARGLRGLPAIHCDMQRLVQAFRNLVVNAIKFTPDGGRIDITASLQAGENGADEQILMAISDTGVGIEQENLELIFEKFYRAYDPSLHSTGSYKFLGAGPGLGLTIAKGVIESHGGKVWAESSGHNMETFPGSTFYVVLPVKPPEETRRVLIEDTATSADAAPTSRPLS